jgi:MFS transporter, DHA3 family, multidrug efflux protein
MSTTTRTLDLTSSADRTFIQLLVNTLLVSVINFTTWFAVTFWVFLETKSVLATGMVAGTFLITTALSGIWFGSLVDQHRKNIVMQASTVVSLAFYVIAFALYQLTPEQTFSDPAGLRLWIFVVLTMLGVITGNIRSIALQTLVTVLIPEDRRDKANGLVGTTNGVSLLVTSVISGLLVAAGDMFYVLLLGMVVLASVSCIWHSFESTSGMWPLLQGTPHKQISTRTAARWIYAARWRWFAAYQGFSR